MEGSRGRSGLLAFCRGNSGEGMEGLATRGGGKGGSEGSGLLGDGGVGKWGRRLLEENMHSQSQSLDCGWENDDGREPFGRMIENST